MQWACSCAPALVVKTCRMQRDESPVQRLTTTAVILAIAAAIGITSVAWGWSIQADPNVKLGAAPLVGQWRWRPSLGTLVALVVAAVLVVGLPVVAERGCFIVVVVTMGAAAALFTFVVAATDGLSHVLDPVVHPTEYWANLATLPPVGDMLRDYGTVDFLLNYSVHAKGHPPGFFLVLKGLAAVGLGAPWVTGALSYIGAFVLPIAVLVTVRAVVSEPAARLTAPFLALVPYAVWMGTSADAFYTAVCAVGIAALIVSRATVAALRRWMLGGLGGLTLAFGLFCTYGVAPLLLLPLGLLACGFRSKPRATAQTAAAAVIAALVVTTGFALNGFWWFDGANTTRQFYWWGTAQFRPGEYFVIGNLGAALIAVGPAVIVALARLRSRAMWALVGSALLCVIASDLSQYSKAEVERIWLLFLPWLVPCVVVLRRRTIWLTVQAATTIILQTWLVSKW